MLDKERQMDFSIGTTKKDRSMNYHDKVNLDLPEYLHKTDPGKEGKTSQTRYWKQACE